MIGSTVLVPRSEYYPLGDTQAVSLTQDLPPEQEAHILLLKCGDAADILFTCFADSARKIDFTCCDAEPGIHARNILLYSLLINDKKDANIKRIWNIYYHWKLDKESVGLLETQAQKLLQLSESMDMWRASVYGSCIRFCDSRSLSLVRSYWNGFWSEGLPPFEKKQRLIQLQTAIDRAKADRKREGGKYLTHESDYCAVSPLCLEAVTDLQNMRQLWWNNGTTLPAPEATELNPMFLFSPNQTLMLHFSLSPLISFPLSTAYVPVAEKSAFFLKSTEKSSDKRLFDCAMSHFTQWASAFRKSVEKGSVIRIICGDALAFCCTLRNCQLTGATSGNLFCDKYTFSPLKLDHSDYGGDGSSECRAPLNFNVVAAGSLADSLGPLNVFAMGTSLLKYDVSSSFYMEMVFKHRDTRLRNWLSHCFGVDVSTISLLLGVILPELYTNATNSVTDEMLIKKLLATLGIPLNPNTCIRSRLRWKRSCGFEDAPHVHIEAASLAKLLVKVFTAMFGSKDSTPLTDSVQPSSPPMLLKQANLFYNCASFALLLNLLRGTVITNWDQCVQELYDSCIKIDSPASAKLNLTEELLLSMHLFGVDNGKFPKLTSHRSQFKGILLPIWPVGTGENMPDQLCVTMCIPREKLHIFTRKELKPVRLPALFCAIEGAEAGQASWLHHFSSIQIAFGTWCVSTLQDSHKFIDEDSSGLGGNSDMFVSFIMPTSILAAAHHSVPFVKCGIMPTVQNVKTFSENLGNGLCIVRRKLMSKHVRITQFMPGMSGLPTLVLDSAGKDETEKTFDTVSVCLTDDGSKIDTIRQSMTPKCPTSDLKQAAKSSAVKLRFDSPMIASIQIGNMPKLKVGFPIPASFLQKTFKIRKKYSYIEVESPQLDPLQEKMASFMFPTFLTKIPGGTIPTPWTSTRVNLDAMPQIDLNALPAENSLFAHIISMFSEREQRVCLSNRGDARTRFKRGLDRLFSMSINRQMDFFSLNTEYRGVLRMIIVPACLRLDLVNRTVVLDAAIIPFSRAMTHNDRNVSRSLGQIIKQKSLPHINMTVAELRAWNAIMPALVERCRTWKHTQGCEYVSAGEVPLSETLTKEIDDDVWPICKCGVGKFPRNYLKALKKELSELSYLIDHHATRVAIAPIFTPPYVEDCSHKEMTCTDLVSTLDDDEYWVSGYRCDNCDVAGHDLLKCLACSRARYCSKKCQRSHWRAHKEHCKYYHKGVLKNGDLIADAFSD